MLIIFIHTSIIFNIIYIIKYIIIMHCGNVETYINRAVVREYPVEKNLIFVEKYYQQSFAHDCQQLMWENENYVYNMWECNRNHYV